MTSSPDLNHSVRIGPAGWSYADWEGVVYPPHGSRFDHLAYLAGFFDTIEINSTFYRIPPVTHARSWVRRVANNPDFRFAVKLYRAFTHEPETLRAEDVAAFRAVLDPMAEAGRLGAVLVQFPWSFKEDGEAQRRLTPVLEHFRGYPLAVEVRHATFQNDAFYALLRDAGVSFVNIDQPLFHDSVKPSGIVTASPAYARLHGRNYQKWFSHAESWERYDYLYSKEELDPWAGRIREMARQEEVFVVTNNHFRGQAIVNAIDLKRAVGQSAAVPPALATTYGERVSGGAE